MEDGLLVDVWVSRGLPVRRTLDARRQRLSQPFGDIGDRQWQVGLIGEGGYDQEVDKINVRDAQFRVIQIGIHPNADVMHTVGEISAPDLLVHHQRAVIFEPGVPAQSDGLECAAIFPHTQTVIGEDAKKDVVVDIAV